MILRGNEGNAMSEQPPVQPPNQPLGQPTNQPPNQPFGQPPDLPPQGNPPTQPMPAAYSAAAAGPSAAPASADPAKANMWHQATSTRGRRWALALSAGALAFLLVAGIALAGFVVLRNHDRFNALGNRQGGQSFGQLGPGNGRGFGNGPGPGAGGGQNRRNFPGVPGVPGGRAQGLGGLGNLIGGTALHGDVTATANGSVQGLVFQRGEATAVSDTSITLKSSDGFVGIYGRTAATRSRGAAIVKGGQAFVLARATDKVAITTIATQAKAGVAPSN
jgi:hypothetical protein